MSAVISHCGTYRYRLDRQIPDKWGSLVLAFFGVNPSTADAVLNDQTLVRWCHFARQELACRFMVGNPFAYRATDVKALATATDPVGPQNDQYLVEIIMEADVLVPCWGSRDKLPKHLRPKVDELADLLFAFEKPVKVFGLTQGGDPLHPLYLPYNTQLQDWKR